MVRRVEVRTWYVLKADRRDDCGSHRGNMSYDGSIIQITQIIHTSNLSALEYLDHGSGNRLSVSSVPMSAFIHPPPRPAPKYAALLFCFL